jgi:hypothetical protein
MHHLLFYDYYGCYLIKIFADYSRAGCLYQSFQAQICSFVLLFEPSSGAFLAGFKVAKYPEINGVKAIFFRYNRFN